MMIRAPKQRSIQPRVLFAFGGMWLLIASSALAYELKKFPPLPRAGNHLGIDDTMSIAVQEDFFVQRELFEGYVGESRLAMETAASFSELSRVISKLAAFERRVDLDRANWRLERNTQTGTINRLASELVGIYEEINLIKLRVLASEQVPREDLLKLQIASRKKALELAEAKLSRSRIDEQFYRRRFEELKSLFDKNNAGIEDYLNELIQLKNAQSMVVTDTRRVDLAKTALAIVERQNHP